MWGLHPSGKNYTFVVRQPVVVTDFASIRWPTTISTPPAIQPIKLHCTEEPEEAEETEETEETDLIVVDGVLEAWFSTVASVEDAWRVAMPSRKRENNRLLFVLARAVKSLELKEGKFPPDKLVDVFNGWYRPSEGFSAGWPRAKSNT